MAELKVWINLAPVFLFIIWLGVGLFTTDYSLPWYAWHTVTGHHFYDIIFCFCFSFYYIWLKKHYRPIWAMVIVAFPISINEWAWWITYYIDHYILNAPYNLLPTEIVKYTQIQALQNLTIFNFTGMAYLILIVLFLKEVKLKNIKPKLPWSDTWFGWFFILTLIYVIWVSYGFHITLDFSGQTIYYAEFWTNIIESLHWLIPTALMLIFFDSLFAQNSRLKGMSPSFFIRFFQGNVPVRTLILEDRERYNPKPPVEPK